MSLPANGTGGSLLNIATGAEMVLQGSEPRRRVQRRRQHGRVGRRSTSQTRFWTESVTQQAPVSMSLLNANATYSDISLDQDGDEAAYLMTQHVRAVEVVVVAGCRAARRSRSTGDLSFRPSLRFPPAVITIALLGTDSSGNARCSRQPSRARLPRTSAPADPAAANSTLHAFVEAQVENGDLATLGR